MAKKFLNIERTIFIVVIVALIFGMLFYTGTLDTINPLKKFEYDWTNSNTNNFVNSEITPYCTIMTEQDFLHESSNEFFQFGIIEIQICADQNTTTGTTEPSLMETIYKFKDEQSTYSAFEKIKAESIATSSDEWASLKNMYLIENDIQDIYYGHLADEGQIYLWTTNNYLFYIMSTETFKTKELIQQIVGEYTNKEYISLNATKKIFELYCGDSICSKGLEDCNSCVKDCGCQSDTKCVAKTYGEGYECKSSSGQYCSWNEDCAEGYCVHDYCRSESTYCGDNYCDEYDSQNPENCGNCPQDCGEDYTQECVNGILKISNGYSCSWDDNCVSGNCVHGVCRSSSTYCGDNWCDYPETMDTCWSDCQ